MDIKKYQEEAYKFAKYDSLEYPFLALGEEVGEVQGKLAKYIRKNNGSLELAITEANMACIAGTPELRLRADLAKELGDVLWQWAACCTELGFDAEIIARANLEKLADRQERNVLVGEGDDR